MQLVVIGRPVSSSSPNIRYLGYRKDIENVYRAADYTILASHYEPFGLIGVESVLCGTPAVLAANIACTEVI
ncbi:glycosyltransferase, partial [Stenotrophomonas maltophilia]|uniref:glycosyltransferase n=1 Tax=Stenotrophomonas maltophilia TaxID=40324 RepID=UPI001953E4C9